MPIKSKLLRRLKLARFVNHTATVSKDGALVKIPCIGLLGYSNLEESEPWMRTLLAGLGRYIDLPGKTFVDVGVNIGQTLMTFRSLFSDVPYTGFEPNPECVFYTNKLIERNGYKNITLYPVGLAENAGVLKLEFYADTPLDSSASIVPGFRPKQKVFRRVNIPVFPMSSLDLANAASVVKIDVEGGELEVLSGMKELLAKDQPLVLTEILPPYESTNTLRVERQQKVDQLFKTLGYSCYQIRKSPKLDFDSCLPISELPIHADVTHSDYLWVPKILAEARDGVWQIHSRSA